MTTVIAIDLDSTLYDFSTPFRQAFFDLAIEEDAKEKYFPGFYHSWDEWRSPADVCGIDAFMKALDRVHSPEVIASRQPFEGSVEVVNELHDQGYELLYLSNRAEATVDVTLQWLHDQEFPLDGHTTICTMADKSEYLSNCQYLIDDRPRTLVEFIYNRQWSSGSRPQRKAFSLMYSYNRALTDIPNIYLAHSWRGLHYYLEEKGVLDGRRSASIGQ